MSSRMKIETLRPEFVECVPEQLKEGVLYISQRFRLCSHKCCCGCGEEVVTPLSPAEWTLTREGELVSLWPSVGNWDYACRSHYVIRRNRVIEALPMTDRQITRVQQRDAADLARLVASKNAEKDLRRVSGDALLSPGLVPPRAAAVAARQPRAGVLKCLRRMLLKLFGDRRQ